MSGRDHRLLIGNRTSFAAAAILLVGSALAVIGLAISDGFRPATLVLLAAMLAGGLLALLGWQRAAHVADVAVTVEESTEVELEETREELRDRLADARRELEAERRRRADVERARDAEQQWSRRLRQQVLKLQQERGALGDTSDIHGLVLRVALELLHAEKGLLLSREDADSDGDLDIAACEGFEHDPEGSAVAQHFASKVLEQDETIREHDASKYGKTPADQEIRNLVAIPIYIQDRFSGVVIGCNKDGGFHEHDDEVLLALGDHAGAVLQNARLHGDLRRSYLTTVAMLADAIEAKDPFMRGHGDDVSRYVGAVGERLGLDPKRREELVFAALLHDIGKIGISERILLKPAALTPEERAVIELHPRIGFRLVERVPVLQTIALAVLHHHERWDGNGYPSRLRGADIPLEARVVTIADAFSAMTSDRPYRPRKTAQEACAELRKCAGTQFDPEIVRLFVEEVERQPPREQDGQSFAAALEDPEFEAVRAAQEPLLGFASFASVDNLTFLYSHRTFLELAHAAGEVAAVQGRPFAVVMVELTDLARANREQGYRVGDAAIQAVARAVQKVAARTGGTAGRYGGRRVALLAPSADEAVAEQLAHEITGELDGTSVRLVSAVWRPGEAGEDVVTRARHALAGADR